MLDEKVGLYNYAHQQCPQFESLEEISLFQWSDRRLAYYVINKKSGYLKKQKSAVTINFFEKEIVNQN